jgi:putative holliday junction resolvase
MPKILAIDYGTKRVGLAISDELELVASPYKTLPLNDQIFKDLSQIIEQKKIHHIVIGIPLLYSERKGESALRIERFAEKLHAFINHQVPITYIDERRSSVEAEAALDRAGIHNIDERRSLVDQLAAVVILQDHLNQQRGPEGYLLPEEDPFPYEDPHPQRKKSRKRYDF